ncbi:hypothetical protein FEM48_Zijuj08G0028600 [Ziziphus jujuba var. spinosa]|uniref:Uncharacterized protein n=1 Tax=Ziziphus jujuba var. spinosa TaxID=714518 RepID=A0A978UWK2_ZIZJJ|nr:hypothetical protein FEM48_Zijuj08G0028600 [Ziziphus jujuba var. spinosa]
MSANAASTLSGDGTIADVVVGHFAMNILQIKWLYHNLAFSLPSEFAVIVSMIPLVVEIVKCLEFSSLPVKDNVQASSNGVESVSDGVSRLNIGGDVDMDSNAEPPVEHQPVVGVKECKCGMPLCICEAPAPSVDVVPSQKKPSSSFVPQSNPKPKKTEAVLKNKGSTSNSKPSSVFNRGQVNNDTADKYLKDYEVNGEGLREAIKNGDHAAVKKLLSEGVDANYHDKQGLSLLHLAAVFNQTDIVFTLMESGASLDYKNAQGETAFDCAPATLQYKMRQKREEYETAKH